MKSLIKGLEQLELNHSIPNNTESNGLIPLPTYRTASVYPNINELVRPNPTKLSKNITKGPYASLTEYLHIHFFLLREDFIKPIRDDILEFLNYPTKKLLNIKLHQVQFIRRGVKKNNECVWVEIKNGLTDPSWNMNKNAKRFMLGSLVIFSKDNFKTIFCGRVADDKNVRYKKLLVSFEDSVKVQYEKNYVMIECNHFFEPYYHALNAIQGITATDFSMQQYLIDASSSVAKPNYLNGISYKYSDPKLNKSQLAAMNGALSEELVVIQGPPGTGKTFLGLEVAKTLLSLSKEWYANTPMLVISCTNHALDQFLEGLTETTDKILRYGSRSQNEKMTNYTIGECRKRFYEDPKNAQYKSAISPLYKQYKTLEDKMVACGKKIDYVVANKTKYVINFDVMGVPETIYRWLNNPDQMISWLLEEDGTISECFPKSTDSSTMATVFSEYVKNGYKTLISVPSLENGIKKLQEEISQISRDLTKKQELRRLTEVSTFLKRKLKYLKFCLEKDFSNPKDIPRSNPLYMTAVQRWTLYHQWVADYEEYLRAELDQLIVEYKPAYEEFSKADQENTLELMRYQKVIGMTTTSAARLRSTIRALKCPIVIVEEAAEVLEAHIIPVLTEYCQHLILIGDHKQLKPSTADYSIETEYELGVSLFERMVNNNLRCYTLNVQHRMRPEISSLIAPSIYVDLQNHESVMNLPDIRGMDKCLYFISHKKPEEKSGDTSKKNIYEAEFLVHLAVYLLKNGYKPEEITILAAYLGQVNALIQEQMNHSDDKVKQVKITSVDNFQGEENKIILLSLVRNNPEKRVGFLATENRICVALSRAREGLYVMGNMAHLYKSSKIWMEIYGSLLTQKAIGFSLPIKCSRHEHITTIKEAKDFDLLAPNGGCNQSCNTQLNCGHKCVGVCHPSHDEYKCMQPCRRSCPRLHKCPKPCHEPCGDCMHVFPKKLTCGHYEKCFMKDSVFYRCVEKVNVRLKCGHEEELECSNLSKFMSCSNCRSTTLFDRIRDVKDCLTIIRHYDSGCSSESDDDSDSLDLY